MSNYRREEYLEVIDADKEDLQKLIDMHLKIYRAMEDGSIKTENGIEELGDTICDIAGTTSTLTAGLAALVGAVFSISNPVLTGIGIATTIASVYLELAPDDRDDIKDRVDNSHTELSSFMQIMNEKYVDKITFNAHMMKLITFNDTISFIYYTDDEYITNYYKLIQGEYVEILY